MKFTEYEAKEFEPWVAHSPFIGWMYSFLSARTFADVLGVVEVTIAILIGLRQRLDGFCKRRDTANSAKPVYQEIKPDPDPRRRVT